MNDALTTLVLVVVLLGLVVGAGAVTVRLIRTILFRGQRLDEADEPGSRGHDAPGGRR